MEKGNVTPIRTMVDALNMIQQMAKENRDIRKGAHDWKMRAKAAEARCKELLEEHVRMQDEHQHDMDKMTELLVEVNEKLAKSQAAWQEACMKNNDMLLEINCLKAHAYDLAFGPVLEREG